MAQKTQLQPNATPGRAYGSFSGKVQTRGGPFTQLQLGAWPGMRYGSFSGKAPAAGNTRSVFLPMIGVGG